MEDIGTVGAFKKIAADIGRGRRAVVAGVTQVLGVIRITAVSGDVVALHPQARVILRRRRIIGPAVRPVTVDAKTPFFGAVRGKTRAVGIGSLRLVFFSERLQALEGSGQSMQPLFCCGPVQDG